MAHALGIIAALLFVYASQVSYTLIRNLLKARAIGLPMILMPVDQSNIFWFVLSPRIRRPLQLLLPARIWQRLSLTIFGWEFHEKTRPFEKVAACHGNALSNSFLLVGLGKLELWTADPVATQDILTRARDFEVPKALEYALAQYGPNILTLNGDKWARHRRVVSSVIDERISKVVFEESIRQTHGLLHEVFSSSQGNTRYAESPLLFDMLRKVAIHVLIAVSMGNKVPWSDRQEKEIEASYTTTHINSLTTAVENIVGAGIIPTRILNHWPSWVPGYRKMRSIGSAKIEVYKRSKSMIDQERNAMAREATNGPETSNMVRKLLQASEEGNSRGQSFTEREMISNLFIFTAAGFETTATTLAYATVLLARYPQWQEWLIEEVDDLIVADGEEPMNYATIIPRATRTLAFMLETVRLYSPVPHVHREITTVQALQTASGTIRLPAGTRVYVNSVALHLLSTWRDINRQSDPPSFVPDRNTSDENEFRPSRWLNPPGSAHPLFRPPRGMFVPWAMGPRICPGQKMAQVEFTAVMLTLLEKHQIEAVPFTGEERRDVEERLDARLRDSQWVTVLQMNGVFKPRANRGLCMRISKRK